MRITNLWIQYHCFLYLIGHKSNWLTHWKTNGKRRQQQNHPVAPDCRIFRSFIVLKFLRWHPFTFHRLPWIDNDLSIFTITPSIFILSIWFFSNRFNVQFGTIIASESILLKSEQKNSTLDYQRLSFHIVIQND